MSWTPSLRFEHTMPRDLTAPAHETASRTGALERFLVLRADFRVEILLRFWTGSTLFGGLPSAHVTLPCIVHFNKNSSSIIFNECIFTIGAAFVNLTPAIAETPCKPCMESLLHMTGMDPERQLVIFLHLKVDFEHILFKEGACIKYRCKNVR